MASNAENASIWWRHHAHLPRDAHRKYKLKHVRPLCWIWNIPGNICQWNSFWCSGSLNWSCRKNVFCFPWGRISTTYAISVLSIDRKIKISGNHYKWTALFPSFATSQCRRAHSTHRPDNLTLPFGEINAAWHVNWSKQILMVFYQESSHNTNARALIQYKDVVLPVKEIPLWRYDGRKIVLSPQWDFLYW